MIDTTKAQAYKEAKETQKLLKDGKKWKIRLWENMGWCWSLLRGRMSLHKGYDGTYFALLSSDGRYEGTGASFWTTKYHSRNPNLVVAEQLKAAKRFIAECQRSIDSVEGL